MRETVFKYPVQLGAFSMDMPAGARVLHVDMQGAEPVMWARVNPSADIVRRRFYCAATGETLPRNAGGWIGTLKMQGGALIFHVFEMPAP
ncbi:MAG: hypothetical protein VXW57_05065 [Pseudomonadota bacterium]|nr:hypothetical protein [Pseudomonadota bacterium]